MKLKTTIVIPTYNEVVNIASLTMDILRVFPDASIIIVDDNSPDGTGDIADGLAAKFQSVSVIHRPRKAGLGTAYVEGFAKALQDGAEIIFEMDGDLSHDPADILAFLDAAREADVVIGSRYKDGVHVLGWRFRRLLLSKMANIFVSHVMIYPVINDYTSGYRCYRRAVLEKIDIREITSDGYAFQIEMAHLAHKHGFRVTEIPIIFHERVTGFSKISRSVVREAFWLTLRCHAPLRDMVRVLAASYKKYLYLGK